MDKLLEIMDHKRAEVAPHIRPVTLRELEQASKLTALRPSFSQALSHPDRLAVIAEIKRRSPSAGAIATGASAIEQAESYARAHGDAVSILTDTRYFGGSLQDLRDVAEHLDTMGARMPILRKDFMVHPIQILEAAEAGASAILIIVRALDDEEIKALYDAATHAGLDSLFEVHSEPEIERALRAGARIVGVNNRDLTVFKTDLGFSERLIPQIPGDVIRISESGIFNTADAARVRAAGADAILVGEALMRASSPTDLIHSFHQAGHRHSS